jgi:hypothetical protein
VYHTLNQRSTKSASRVVVFAYLDEDKVSAYRASRTISRGRIGIASPSRLGRRCPSITSLSITRASNAIGDTLLPPRLPGKKMFLDERSEFHLKGIGFYASIRVLKKFSDPKKIFLPPGGRSSLPIKNSPYKE